MSDKSYPTEHEARVLLEAIDAVQGLTFSGADDGRTADIINQANKELVRHFQDIFNSPETSPWKAEVGKGKLKAVFREGWHNQNNQDASNKPGM